MIIIDGKEIDFYKLEIIVECLEYVKAIIYPTKDSRGYVVYVDDIQFVEKRDCGALIPFQFKNDFRLIGRTIPLTVNKEIDNAIEKVETLRNGAELIDLSALTAAMERNAMAEAIEIHKQIEKAKALGLI